MGRHCGGGDGGGRVGERKKDGGWGWGENRGRQKTTELAVSPAATQAYSGHQRRVNPDLGGLQW